MIYSKPHIDISEEWQETSISVKNGEKAQDKKIAREKRDDQRGVQNEIEKER